MPNDAMQNREWLRVRDVQTLYGLGRDQSSKLVKLLPHVTTGHAGRGARLLVHRGDLDAVLQRARQSGTDLCALTRDHTPETLKTWLEG